MAFAPFVPLRVLSSYSMLEGAVDPKAFAKLAKERGFPAIAMTDRNGLYGAMSFASACKDAGVQPIVGTLLGVARGDGNATVDWLVLLAQDKDRPVRQRARDGNALLLAAGQLAGAVIEPG